LTRTLARAERLADAGADYLVVAAPFYYAVTSEASVVEYFEAVADRAAAPVVLYNIPQNTHLALAPSTVRRLAGHPNIVGIKDSAGDWIAFDAFLALRANDFSVMQGREHLAAISLWAGADGVISAMANFAPRLLQALAASVREERPRAETLALQATIGGLAAVFDQGDWLSGLKVTLQALGWNVGEPSPPITSLDAAQRHVVAGIVGRPEMLPWLTTPPILTRPSLRAID
jgi:dihydrodipicolinate synthase/N-acetylneuraminate lyase